MKSIPNSTNIEMSAVNKIEDALLRIGRIEPDIRGNDKTPSWDGELRVYKGQEFNKAQMLGRIPIQVKGTWTSRFQKPPIKFNVEVSDLRNYQKDGGVIYFVVHLKDYDNYCIYYKLLLPFDLKMLLAECEGQKTKRIRLDKFPHRHVDGMMRIFMEFIINKQKQGTLLPNISSMGDLSNAGIEIERFEFAIPQIGIESAEDAFSYLLKEEPYIYAKPKGIEASFVVDKIRPELISQERNNPIILNGETLFESISIIRKNGSEPQIKIGKGISVIYKGEALKLDYTYTGTLSEQIAQMKFLCAILEKQNLSIGQLALSDGELQLASEPSNEYADRLAWLQKIDQTLKKLNVFKDLNLDILDESDFKKINMLIATMLEGKAIPLSINGKAGIGALTIGNIKIMLICKQSNAEKLFFISNLLTSKDMALSSNDDPQSEKVPISPYIMLKKDELTTIDNIDFLNLADCVMSFPYTDTSGAQITFFVLELLKYFDSQETSDFHILNIAEELTNYLLVNNKGSEDIHKINLLQIMRRRRELNQEENRYLISLKQERSPAIQLAASILLESFQEAEFLYEKLDEQQKTNFKSYPIYNLWKRNTLL